MARSFIKNEKCLECSLEFNLFTDNIEVARKGALDLQGDAEFIFSEIPNYGWPEATLLRYEILQKLDFESNCDFILYIDSDMLVLKPFIHTLSPNNWTNGLATVLHPGFSQSKSKIRFKYFMNLTYLKSCLKELLHLSSSNGAWEMNKTSTAYTPKEFHKNYVHGAIWMGRPKEFKAMCERLAANVKLDLDRNYVAVWHDESHLNWFISQQDVTILGSEYSGFKSYIHASELDSYVVTVAKIPGEGRKPTSIA